MKGSSADKTSDEYQRFEALARGLVEVPKSEIDAALKREKAKKAKAKKAKAKKKSPRPATASQ